MASEIEELKEYAITDPPKTEREKNKTILLKSVKPTLLTYIIYSLIIGICSSQLEKEKYNSFQNNIDKQDNTSNL